MNNFSEQKISEIAREAALAPKAFMNASMGDAQDSLRPKGMTLTVDQIVALHLYEQKGLQLPTSAEKVIAYLGYTDGAGRGLEPQDFLRTFGKINNHAKRWNPIRQRIKDLGGELKVFSVQMLGYGVSIEEVINSIKGTQTLDALGIHTTEDLMRVQLEMGDKFPGITLDAKDADTATDFGYYIDQVLKKVAIHERNSELLKADLTAFGDELANVVRPEVTLKLTAIENSTLKDEVIELKKVIDDRATEIDELTRAYKKMVQDSLQAAAGMNLVGLGMAIYFGVEAEQIRKTRNELKSQQSADIQLMLKKNKIIGRLSVIKADMQDLELLTIDADVATKNLITVWNKLHHYILASKEEADFITDALLARRFARHFAQVVEPWNLIRDQADDLIGVFAEADDEIKRLKKIQ
jgi:hypothetical protein